jgi:hypothetical protein
MDASIYFFSAGFTLFGVVGVFLGWSLFVRYRREFLDDPAKTMSIEVFAKLIGFGGYGYFAALALVLGSACVLLGVGTFILVLLSRLRWI